MTLTILSIFVIVYLGMILGGLPFLQLDRTGVALLGAIALISLDAISLQDAVAAVHLPTIILLFSFMVISAQMRLGGFYSWATRGLANLPLSPARLLGVLILMAGALSAVFSNDIVCLAVAPVLVQACLQRRLDPVPFLLGLACAANIGSAATLIGNPQNILIGQTLKLAFGDYLATAALPVLLGLLACWGIIAWQTQGRWQHGQADEATVQVADTDETPPDLWQTGKGLAIAAVLMALFLFSPLPQEHVALTGAGLLLMSRKLHSTRMLGLVDWEVLVLFAGLFVVNHALQSTGLPAEAVRWLAAHGFQLGEPWTLFGTTFVLSNTISNVPAVMLLLPLAAHPQSGSMMALVSTLAGNLLIVGSIANILVVDAAARHGVHIDWRRHARVGVPVTLCSLLICALLFAIRM
ncbi:anion transporter [Vogesella oryzae]|uniref:anion transporter n=1 Tax=Vogesella oryzae TaxID=1735285 RepID=UPI0015816B99|nr:anion transporter [Vogesella oryzae]